MNKNIVIEEEILTDATGADQIVTDEMNEPERGQAGARGRDGKDGINGKDGKDGKDGVDGKDGRDGKDGIDGRDGVDGKDGRDGIDGKNGRNGRDGVDGKNGKNGKAGSEWFLFLATVDEKVGKEGDFALVQGTSNYYHREYHDDNLIWKFKGNLRGLKGEDGKDGTNGRDGGGGGLTINHIYKRGVVLFMFDSVMIPAKGNDKVLVLEIPQHKAADLLKVDLSGENIGEFVYGTQTDMNDDDTFVQIGIKRTNYTKYNESVELHRKTVQGNAFFVVKAMNPRPTSGANYEATVFYDLYDSVVI